MWEDNNPLSYERRDSISSAGASADPYQNPLSPSFQPIDPDNQNLQHAHLYSNANKDTEANRSEEDDDDDVEDLAARRERGFTSRVEQILFENKDLTIYITDAGKSHEGGGNYIVYTIRTGVSFDLLAEMSSLYSGGVLANRWGWSLRYRTWKLDDVTRNSNLSARTLPFSIQH